MFMQHGIFHIKSKTHVVYLCTIYESNHAVLIKDIDNFLTNVRHGHVHRGNKVNKKMCKICTMYQPTADIENHYNCCKSDK